MHSINLIREETAATLDAVVIKFVPFRYGGDFGAGEFGKWVQRQAVDDQDSRVAHAEDKQV